MHGGRRFGCRAYAVACSARPQAAHSAYPKGPKDLIIMYLGYG